MSLLHRKRRFPLSKSLGICCLILLNCMTAIGQPPIHGEMPQTVLDVYLPKVQGIKVETWVDSLQIPWSLLFLPNQDALVAERPGRILRIPQGTSSPTLYAEIADVIHEGDAGLMGMALHPAFEDTPYVYVMHSYRENGQLYNRIIRLTHQETRGTFDRVIFDKLPGSGAHIGGRIAFGPDGMLYVGTGDTNRPPISQDLNSLGGKILRLTPEGKIPQDNPFDNSPVYSYGHRVVQGLAWDKATGALFNSEHGPSGAEAEGKAEHRDEINRVIAGKNYGWPKVVGAPHIPQYQDPIAMWKNQSVPPAGMTFYRGDLYVATLGSQALVRIQFRENYEVRRIERWFALTPSAGIYGRLRDVTVGPDGHLYVCTSNTDGRAELRPRDDKILRITFNPPHQK